MTTNANKNLESLKRFVRLNPFVTLHINSSRIASLMRDSHFAIATPSVTLNELWYLNVPFIAIQTATNQSDMAEFVRCKRKPLLKRFNSRALENHIRTREKQGR